MRGSLAPYASSDCVRGWARANPSTSESCDGCDNKPRGRVGWTQGAARRGASFGPSDSGISRERRGPPSPEGNPRRARDAWVAGGRLGGSGPAFDALQIDRQCQRPGFSGGFMPTEVSNLVRGPA